MRLDDITIVLCLSRVLMFFYASSQPTIPGSSSLRCIACGFPNEFSLGRHRLEGAHWWPYRSRSSCRHGWFGHQCKYKCRCDTNCDVNGSCITPSICRGGWFGPACQYADLAYFTSNVSAVTDGKDDTCNDPNAGDSITIPLQESFVFTWLRVHVRDQGSGALASLSVTFLSKTGSVPCPGWRKHSVSKRILDMHCDLSKTVYQITLTGRNVAVNETASQDTNFQLNVGGVTHYLDAYKAVDGNTDHELNSLSCSHTDGTTSWTVTLSRPRSVHRYAIYNRGEGYGFRLVGFQLESFDHKNHSVFVYKDNNIYPGLIYSFIHSPLLVQRVVVTVENAMNMLTLCEVEIYGDSVCDAQHYGRDCEHSCTCLTDEACFVSTGACPSDCPVGESCSNDRPKSAVELTSFIIGIIVGVVGLLLVLFLLFFFFWRKGKPPQTAESTTVTAQQE